MVVSLFEEVHHVEWQLRDAARILAILAILVVLAALAIFRGCHHVDEDEEDCDQLLLTFQLFHCRSNRSLSSIGRCLSRWCLGMHGFVFPSLSVGEMQRCELLVGYQVDVSSVLVLPHL